VVIPNSQFAGAEENEFHKVASHCGSSSIQLIEQIACDPPIRRSCACRPIFNGRRDRIVDFAKQAAANAPVGLLGLHRQYCDDPHQRTMAVVGLLHVSPVKIRGFHRPRLSEQDKVSLSGWAS
jgi:hypothetical protein